MTLLALALVLTGCGPPAATAPPGPSTSAGQSAAADAPAEGWRWESYRGVELQVPDDYRNGTAGSPTYSAWCTGRGRETAAGVNRAWNSIVPAIACPEDRPTSSYAASVDVGAGGLGSSARLVDLGDGWVSETVEVAGVAVTVTDDDEERRQAILRTVRAVHQVDAHGCPTDSPLRAVGARPEADRSTAPEDVTSVAVCRYGLTPFVDDAPLPPLLSSILLQGGDARGLIAAIGAAPEGGGPDSPESCSEDVRLGEELLVLKLASAEGPHDVVVRYSGCDGHGIDDGTVVRALTADVLDRVLAGPNAPTVLSGDVARLWRP